MGRVARILVVDDDPLVRQMLLAGLSNSSRRITEAENLSEARGYLDKNMPDVVLLDHLLPDGKGLDLLDEIISRYRHIRVLFVTADIGSHTALEAMKRGAFDYLTKPLDLELLDRQIALALEASQLMRVPVVVSGDTDPQDELSEVLIGKSAQMAEVFKAMGRAAACDAPVVLVGDVGTGKSLVARAIVGNSSVASSPFLTLSCGDARPELLEQQLFGSTTNSTGAWRECRGGTLLLQDIGELSFGLQGKLHQAIYEQNSRTSESAEDRGLNVRVIATSPIPLEQLVASGTLRPELYYCLRTITISLPPLRERFGDLPDLIDHFVRRFNRLSIHGNAPAARVSSEALDLLRSYSWPGNLDELQSVIRQVLVENNGTILPSASLERLLRPPVLHEIYSTSHDSAVTDWRTFVATRLTADCTSVFADAVGEMERHLIALVLEATGGNQAQAARRLGITRGSLRRKVRQLGLLGKASENEETSEELSHADFPDSSPLELR